MPTATVSTYELVEYAPWHIDAVMHTAIESQHWKTPPPHAGREDYPMVARTLLINGIPWVTGGLVVPWPRLGYGWLFCRAAGGDMARRIPWYIRRAFRQIRAETRVQRIEMLVLADFEEATRLAGLLGFQQCCTKEGYGPEGETFYEYVWRA